MTAVHAAQTTHAYTSTYCPSHERVAGGRGLTATAGGHRSDAGGAGVCLARRLPERQGRASSTRVVLPSAKEGFVSQPFDTDAFVQAKH